eukprot:CAMPEP_0113579326 /NCGR_PEP_ID=MMETSP0015_2-20120614/30009_1 /TAXON_ID=2838 /ORGANISM="Odontella" /LENGTH=491 /DNA_ID=CAMNT_0000483299 /DNA_START=153 /DNA_END=1625 /DNA_ORIENTATION=+ /assembly_acc=CAM_ASM_000160
MKGSVSFLAMSLLASRCCGRFISRRLNQRGLPNYRPFDENNLVETLARWDDQCSVKPFRRFSISRGGISSDNATKTVKFQRYIQQVMGGIFSTVGFMSSSATSLLSNRNQFVEWKRCLDELDSYLKGSGIDEEVSKVVNKRLLDNLVILGRTQSAVLQSRELRDLARVHPLRQTTPPPFSEAARFMKFATSAYGESMIRAADMHSSGKIDTDILPPSRRKIAKHVGILEEDVRSIDIDDAGGNLNHLRHFVAIDRGTRSIVLSIRGTFNLAELVVDFAAFSRPFMGGEAHSEMATMAERVWEAAGDTVRDLLEEQGEDYGLVIVGHSLGAGTACLLNILIHNDRKRHVHGRRVRCFAFASPPVFSPLCAAPWEALRSASNYIHEHDVVPFLSVDSFRHFCARLAAVNERTKTISWLERKKLVTGLRGIDADMCRDILQPGIRRLRPKSGAPLLAIPAATNIWIKEKGSSRDYDAQHCDSLRLAKLGIIVGP